MSINRDNRTFDQWLAEQEKKNSRKDVAKSSNPFEDTREEWEKQAEIVLTRFQHASEDLYNRSPWNRFSLSFKDSDAEKGFASFYCALHGHKIRRRLLSLNFCYMIYATVEWGTQHMGPHQKTLVTIIRTFYVLLNLLLFTFSFIYRDPYAQNTSLVSALLSFFTCLVIITEGLILGIPYNPYIVIILVLYLTASSILLRPRFVGSLLVGLATLCTYNISCYWFDIRYQADPFKSTEKLIWYNFVLLCIIGLMGYMTRKNEIAIRYAYLLWAQSTDVDQLARERMGLLASGGYSSYTASPRRKHPSASKLPSRGNPFVFDHLFEHYNSQGMEDLITKSGVHNIKQLMELLNEKAKMQGHREEPTLMELQQLPPWFSGYPFILTGYRIFYSVELCLKSMFTMHNELINIWTEFLPMILFALGWSYFDYIPLVHLPRVDSVLVVMALIVGVIVRPLFSGLAHMFYCQSQKSFVLWWSIDYMSILVAIFFASIVHGRFTFYCLFQQQLFFYISLSGLFLSTVASVCFVASTTIRTSSFLLYVIFANGVPLAYQVALKLQGDPQNDVPWTYIIYWIAIIVVDAIGLTVKSVSVPERCFPGRFDVVGASHQIWHIIINAGNIFEILALRSYLIWRETMPCPS